MKNRLRLLLSFLILSGCKLDLTNEDSPEEPGRIIFLGKISEPISSVGFTIYKDSVVTNGTDTFELKINFAEQKIILKGTRSDGAKCRFNRPLTTSESETPLAQLKSINLCRYEGSASACLQSYLPSSSFSVQSMSANYYLVQYFSYCPSSQPSACDGAELFSLDQSLTVLIEADISNCQ